MAKSAMRRDRDPVQPSAAAWVPEVSDRVEQSGSRVTSWPCRSGPSFAHRRPSTQVSSVRVATPVPPRVTSS